MFKNYFITTLRTLLKNRLNTAINIIGLSVGFAAAIVIMMWTSFELTYDDFWVDGDQVFRIETSFHAPGTDPNVTTHSGGPARDALINNFAQVQTATNFFYRNDTLRYGDGFIDELVIRSDANFFDVLNIPFIEGNAETALIDPSSIVLSARMAQKYFGDESALGAILTLEGIDRRVTGVFEDLPQNTHLVANMVYRYDENTRDQWLERWFWTNFFTYGRLQPGAELADVEAGLTVMRNRELKPHMEELGIPYEPHEVIDFQVVSLPDIHLYSAKEQNITAPGSLTNIYTGMILASFVVLLAAINFINLSTARGILRAPEIALRKVMGGSRGQLVQQFLGESVILSVAGYSIALLGVKLMTPFIVRLLSLPLNLDGGLFTVIAVSGLVVSFIIGVLSGIYPALVLTAFKPSKILGSNKTTGSSQSPLRQALVTFQFAISIILILATVIVVQQNRYASTYDLGFERENKLVISGSIARNSSAYEAIKTLYLNHPDTLAVTRSRIIPSEGSEYMDGVFLPGAEKSSPISVQQVGFDFFETYGAKMLAGRAFDIAYSLDVLRASYDQGYKKEANVILNEAALGRFGYANAEAAIGEQFKMSLGDDDQPTMTIVGVVEDIHFRSIHSDVRSMLFVVDYPQMYNVTVSFKTSNLPQYLSFVDDTWTQFVPDAPIYRAFLEETINQQYEADKNASKAIILFAGLATLISVLGLYGLAQFNILQRTKEIGIRKVLGAEVVDIIKLLLWQFSRPVMAANLLAWPIAYYAMNSWLQNFAFRIDISLVVFLAASITALLVAWLTVGTHAYKVAKTKPIVALRYE